MANQAAKKAQKAAIEWSRQLLMWIIPINVISFYYFIYYYPIRLSYRV